MITNTPTLLIILVGSLLLLIVIVFIASMIGKTRRINTEADEKYLDQLITEINEREQQLHLLNGQLHNRTINHTSSMTKVESQALDIYVHSNIRIPVDIIEELSVMRFSTTLEAYSYIENQRQYWKYENTKKPYKGAKDL